MEDVYDIYMPAAELVEKVELEELNENNYKSEENKIDNWIR